MNSQIDIGQSSKFRISQFILETLRIMQYGGTGAQCTNLSNECIVRFVIQSISGV